jgi:hypothetical protein
LGFISVFLRSERTLERRLRVGDVETLGGQDAGMRTAIDRANALALFPRLLSR